MDTGKSALGLDGNIAAALGYPIGIIAIICLIIEKENRFVKFHALQSILLHVAAIVLMIALWIIGVILAIAGMAAAAAFSSAASALPCAATVPSKITASGFTCAVNDETVVSPRDRQGDQ